MRNGSGGILGQRRGSLGGLEGVQPERLGHFSAGTDGPLKTMRHGLLTSAVHEWREGRG